MASDPMTSAATEQRAVRWLVEHKWCSGFPQCWEAAPADIREYVIAAWGSDPSHFAVQGGIPAVATIRPRRGDLEAATQPHPFRPSGQYVGGSRAEVCDLCGLAQRGPCTMHPEAKP